MGDLVGKIIDKYELVRLIGEGGMGSVYEARHTLIKKKCALKLLHSKLSEDDVMVQRMLREAQAAAAIGHPNIVETFDFGATPENFCYLVMEYLDGESLGEVLSRKGVMEVGEAVEVVIQVLEPLEAAHDVGIIHRDLKPENIFIAKGRRGGQEVKILDFGISKMLAGEEGSPHLTKTGALLGTPFYMSPEQAEGAERVDAQTDLWAVGVILFQMLTGRVPFAGTNYNQIILKIVMETPPPLRSLRPDLSEELQGFLLKAMHQERAERFESATDMVAALAPFRDARAMTLGDISGKHRLLDEGAWGAGSQPGAVPLSTPARAERSATAIGTGPGAGPSAVTGTGRGAVAGTAPGVQSQPGGAGVRFGGEAKGAAEGGPAAQGAVEERGVGAGGRSRPVSATSPAEVMAPENLVVGGRSKKLIGILAGGAGLAAVVLALLIFAWSGSGSDDEAVGGDGKGGGSGAAGTVGKVSGDAKVGSGDHLSPASNRFRVNSLPVKPQTLEVRVVGMPSGARVYLDGKKAALPLKTVADGKTHELEVRAKGYESFRHPFVARKGVGPIQVSMKKVGARRRRRTRRDGRASRHSGKRARASTRAGGRRATRPARQTRETSTGVFTSPYD